MPETAHESRHSLTSRLLVYGTLASLLLILLVSFLVDRSIRQIWLDELDRDLATLSASARVGMPERSDALQDWADRAGASSGVRVTLIDAAGVVWADSETDPGSMDNHADRVEVAAALAGSTGRVTRVSATTGISERYVAPPVEDGWVVRVSTPTRTIEGELNRTRSAITRVSMVVAALALGALVIVGRRVARPITALAEQAGSLATGDLEVSPARSSIAELDQLGGALGSIAANLGGRVADAEAAQTLLETVLGTLPQGTVLFNGDETVVYSNPAAAELLGFAPPSLANLSPFQLQAAIREARRDDSTVVREIDHGVPKRRIRATATPFADGHRILLILVDITERSRIDAMRRDFVANASHELKTPVATVIASSEAMQIALSRGDQSAQVFASRIEESARQLERLVGDLLDLSRLEGSTLEAEPVDLGSIVVEEVDRVQGHGVSVAADVESAMVLGNRRDLSVAVRNLLDNALRYTPRGGAVTVSVRSSQEQARLVVSDTGEGIPSRDLDRIFERFYRVDAARSRATGGTGLGLAIVRHVAESHGGVVTVESELGVGSTFTIVLPLLNSAGAN